MRQSSIAKLFVVPCLCACLASGTALAESAGSAPGPAPHRSRASTAPELHENPSPRPPGAPMTTTMDAGARPIRDSRPEGVADALPPGGRAPTPVAPACPPAGVSGDVVRLESNSGSRHVDSCGNASSASDSTPRAAAGGSATIDRMTTTIGYYATHYLGGSLNLAGSAGTYLLSDGSSWSSGAGSYYLKSAYLDHVEVSGSTIRYFLQAPPDGLIYSQTDYDSGDHSAQGSLGVVSPLVLVATIGEATAKLSGTVSVASNDPTWYGEPRFNYYSAIPGSQVPFELTYTLSGAVWQPDTFDTMFDYYDTGWVDFAHPTSTPALSAMTVRGPSQVPPNASTPFAAIATFEGGVERDVSAAAAWQAGPSSLVTILGGVLSTGAFATDRQPISIQATYSSGGTTISSRKAVLGRSTTTVPEFDTWPMYQFDERHTGYTHQTYDPETFSLRWQKSLAPGYALNPVSAADGRVFVSLVWYFGNGASLFALDSRDGETLWSKALGSPFSVNPPSVGYGSVYLQTCNNGGDTWLYAFDAETGDTVFRSSFGAQWERYYSPTIYDGTIYIDGGSYGGMYAFDAYSGAQRWFAYLPQYDQWTPAIAGNYAYAYVGEYSPGLYVIERSTGQLRVFIPDLNFDWNGWSMDLAPVVLENGDALAIHNGRLIRFDLQGKRIAWERKAAFSGQPSVSKGVIYAVNGGRVVALDEASGNELWGWSSPRGTPKSPMIVTDSHVFVSTADAVYAVDLLSQDAAWSYPAGGSLALGDENLYIAQSNGILTAVAAAPYAPAPPVSLEIRGPDNAVEMTSTPYKAFVHYADGRVRDRTRMTGWSVAPSNYATIDASGVLTVGEMLDLSQDVTITAQYSEAGSAVQSTLTVHLAVSVTLQQFLERNRLRASASQLQAIQEIGQALDRERAILRALGPPPASGELVSVDAFRQAIAKAIVAGEAAAASAQRAVDQLAIAGQIPIPGTAPTPPPAPALTLGRSPRASQEPQR